MASRSDESPADGDLIFVSYSRRDDAWTQRFGVLLKPLVRQKRLRLWVDTAIRPGDRWSSEIERAISQSRVALLLVSADYLASDFVMEQELPALRRAGVRLAPVLVGDCLWREVPELAEVQWLNDPAPDEALNLASDAGQRDRRIRAVCDRLMEITPAAEPAEPEPTTPHPAPAVAAVLEGDVRGDLSGVPSLPPGYVLRDELDEVVDEVVASTHGGAVGLTAEPTGLGLHGLGGIGKSVLAAAVARDDRIRRRFPDGVYWITVGEHPDLLAAQIDLLDRLGGAAPAPRTVAEAGDALRATLAERRVLLVVDDVWSATAALEFRVTGAHGRVLFTSRDQQVLATAGVPPRRLGVLSAQGARTLAAGILNCPVAELPAAADHAFGKVGRVPLAVALLAATVRGGTRSWNQVGADLDQDMFGEHPYADTFRAMRIGTADLPVELRTALFGLAVFPPDTSIPTIAIARYWALTRGSTPEQTAADLAELAGKNVLRRDGDTIQLHDLQHDYLLLHAPALASLHIDLLQAYRTLLPAGSLEWWRLPPEEPYIWEHLAAHLAGAGDHTSLAETVSDPAYQARRIVSGGPYAGEADLTLAARYLPDDQLVAWWQRWLARHVQLFARQRPSDGGPPTPPSRIAGTLLAWLDASPDRPPQVRPERLAPLLSRPYLAVHGGLVGAPSTLLRALTSVADIAAIAWCADGDHLLTAGHGEVRRWDLATGAMVSSTALAEDPGFTVASFTSRWHPTGHPRVGDRAAVEPDHRSAHRHPARGGREALGDGVVPGRHPPGGLPQRWERRGMGPRRGASHRLPRPTGGHAATVERPLPAERSHLVHRQHSAGERRRVRRQDGPAVGFHHRHIRRSAPRPP